MTDNGHSNEWVLRRAMRIAKGYAALGLAEALTDGMGAAG
jgi:hypothetical protein